MQPIEPEELAAAVRALLRIRRAEDRSTYSTRSSRSGSTSARANSPKRTRNCLKEMAQRQKAEAALVQSQKMEAIGQLTGGIAHDFNNLLTAVVGNLDLIRSRVTDARMLRLAENAYRAAERGSKLTAQLLAFSRTQKLRDRAVDVVALIRA